MLQKNKREVLILNKQKMFISKKQRRLPNLSLEVPDSFIHLRPMIKIRQPRFNKHSQAVYNKINIRCHQNSIRKEEIIKQKEAQEVIVH